MTNPNCDLLKIPADSKEWVEKFKYGCPNAKPEYCKKCELNSSDEP